VDEREEKLKEMMQAECKKERLDSRTVERKWNVKIEPSHSIYSDWPESVSFTRHFFQGREAGAESECFLTTSKSFSTK